MNGFVLVMKSLCIYQGAEHEKDLDHNWADHRGGIDAGWAYCFVFFGQESQQYI